MIHVVRFPDASASQYFVDAEDATQSLRILEVIGVPLTDAIVEPYIHPVHRRTKIYTLEDARVPLLGGSYVLKLKDVSGWVEVASVKLGPLWTDIYTAAQETYGAENVDYDFVLDNK